MQVTGASAGGWRRTSTPPLLPPATPPSTRSSCQTCGSMRTTVFLPACPLMRTSTCLHRALSCTSRVASGTRRSPTKRRSRYTSTISPVPWVDAVLVTLRAKLLRDPAWRAGAHDLWDASRRSHAAATADRLLDALAAAVDSLTADDVLATPAPAPRECARVPRSYAARAPVSARTSADERRLLPGDLLRLRPMAGAAHDAGNVPTLPGRLPVLCGPCGRGGLSARDLASLVPGLSVDEGLQLIRILLEVGFVRPAMADDASGKGRRAAYTQGRDGRACARSSLTGNRAGTERMRRGGGILCEAEYRVGHWSRAWRHPGRRRL